MKIYHSTVRQKTRQIKKNDTNKTTGQRKKETIQRLIRIRPFVSRTTLWGDIYYPQHKIFLVGFFMVGEAK